jgi:opacity protein-like surface antigen
MKKVLILSLALLLGIGATAQVKFGVKAGLNVAQIGGGTIENNGVSTDVDASDILAGFHVGGYVNFNFGPILGLQPEVVFSMQGDKESEGGVDVTTRLNYINVPVLLDIKPFTGFSILVGPQIGINMYKSMSAGDESISGSDLGDFLEANGTKINTIDFAAVLGVQYTFIGHLTVGARYNFGLTSALGLTDAAKDAGRSLSGGANRVIQVSVGWTF